MLLLNYKPVLDQPTGIGVYATAVLPALQNFEHVLIPGGGSGGVNGRLQRLAWSQFQLPKLARKYKADLIFTPAPEGYLGEQVVSQIVMVHDLRPLSHPDLSMQSLYFRKWVPPLLRQCRHIITNSNFTASEIRGATGLPADKISVTPLGYDTHHFYPSEVKERLHSRAYLLHVGQAYPHKNLERLLYAFKMISHRFPEVDLVLLGKPYPSETHKLRLMASELGLSKRVIFKSYVPYEELPNWYRGAIAFVYPSLWEGFGLPILEAMAWRCPVITSFGSGMQEVSGNAALMVDPFSIEDIKDAIGNVIDDQHLNQSLCSSGELNALKYSWKQCAQNTKQVIEGQILQCSLS